MKTAIRDERFARRIAELYSSDAQFADARPRESISQAIDDPRLRLREIVQTVMDGYAERPALGQRAVKCRRGPEDRPYLTGTAA